MITVGTVVYHPYTNALGEVTEIYQPIYEKEPVAKIYWRANGRDGHWLVSQLKEYVEGELAWEWDKT